MLCARLCRAACARLRRPHTLCALRGCAAPPARGCAARPCSVRGCAVPPARLRGTRGRSRPPLSPLPPTPTPWNRQRRCQGRCQCRHVAAVAVAERRMSSPRAVRGGPRPTQTRPLVRCALVKHATIGGRLTRPLARTSPCGTRRRSWLLVQLLLVACSYSLLAHRRRARRSRPLAARRRSSPPPLTAPSRAVATRHRTRPAHGCLLSWPLVARRRSPPLAAARRRSRSPIAAAPARRSLATRNRSPPERYPSGGRSCLVAIAAPPPGAPPVGCQVKSRCVLSLRGRRLPFLCVLAVPCLSTDCVLAVPCLGTACGKLVIAFLCDALT